ncbi:hypothetical protein Tco_0566652 [Tanacetum coccineum]
MDKGLKKRCPPHKLKAETGRYIMACQNHKLIADIENEHHGPSDAMHNLSQPLAFKIMHKYEHVGQRTKVRNVGKDDKTLTKAPKSEIASMKVQVYNKISEDKDQEHSSLNDKSNLTDLMKECHL